MIKMHGHTTLKNITDKFDVFHIPQDQQMHFGVMDVILLHSSHQHVTAMSAQSIS
jgi:hypothetical protein